VANGAVIRLRDAHEDEATEGAVIGLPNFVRFGMENRVRTGKCALEPPSETQVISLAVELEAPFLPVGFGKIEAEISRPGVVRHKTFSDGYVTGRGGDGIQTSSGGGIQTRWGPPSGGSGSSGTRHRLRSSRQNGTGHRLHGGTRGSRG